MRRKQSKRGGDGRALRQRQKVKRVRTALEKTQRKQSEAAAGRPVSAAARLGGKRRLLIGLDSPGEQEDGRW